MTFGTYSPHGGCAPTKLSCAPAPRPATATTSNATSCRCSARSPSVAARFPPRGAPRPASSRSEIRPRDPPHHPRRLDRALEHDVVGGNVALVARVPRPPAVTTPEPQAWTAEQLQAFLRAAAGHELHASRGKTADARRRIDLDPTTVSVVAASRQWQQTEQHVTGIERSEFVFTDREGEPVHPHATS